MELLLNVINAAVFPLTFVMIAWANIKLRKTNHELLEMIGATSQMPVAMYIKLVDAGYDPEELQLILGSVQIEVPEEFLTKRKARRLRKDRALSTKQAKADLVQIAQELSQESE